MSKRSKALGTLKNDTPKGPSTAGGAYIRHYNEEAMVWAWRKLDHALYYRDKDGKIHAYQPGLDKDRDKIFPGLAKKLGLVIVGRSERRALYKAEKKKA